jgi:hypothetical protein
LAAGTLTLATSMVIANWVYACIGVNNPHSALTALIPIAALTIFLRHMRMRYEVDNGDEPIKPRYR